MRSSRAYSRITQHEPPIGRDGNVYADAGELRIMMKAGILEQIGQRSLLLPELINQGLAATERLKYYLTLLQTAYGYAGASSGQASDLRAEREAAGISDETLDAVVGNSRMLSPTVVHIPGAAAILERIFAD